MLFGELEGSAVLPVGERDVDAVGEEGCDGAGVVVLDSQVKVRIARSSLRVDGESVREEEAKEDFEGGRLVDENEEMEKRKVGTVLLEREPVLEEKEQTGGGVGEKGEEEHGGHAVRGALSEREPGRYEIGEDGCRG